MFRCQLLILVALSCVTTGSSQTPLVKTYRGAIGNRHVEIKLNVTGSKATGSYFYDRYKQDIPLEGSYNEKSELQLVEGTGKRKTGRFVCKVEPESPDTDLECEWSRPDGTGKAFVFLVEQGIRSTNGTQVVPKLISDPKTKASASLPQLTATVNADGVNGFNRLMESRMVAAMKEFQPESVANSAFDTNYNVLLLDDSKISVEMVEYSDVGAAHPNTRLWTVNYNLKTNKELTLKDVFKDGDDYKTAIAEFVTKDINQRADKLAEDEARRNNSKPEKRDDPVIAEDGLPEMDTWGVSTKGFVVYFDFPHVMAVFDKTVIPYSVLARYFQPDGIITPVK